VRQALPSSAAIAKPGTRAASEPVGSSKFNIQLGERSLKHLSNTLWLLSTLVILGGCGTGGGTPRPAQLSQTQPAPTQPAANNSETNVTGNWQFSMTSTVSKAPSLTMAGSINRSGNAVTGTVHVDGSNCFDHLTTTSLAGTVSDSNISLTSESISGQVITLNGTIARDALTGSYTIDGGCAAGDQGNVTGVNIPYIGNTLGGTFTPSGGQTFDISGDWAQNASASSDGSFGLTGTVTFSGSCLGSGTITSGTFPSGSYIMGTSVALEIQTSNGTLTFVGKLSTDRSEISGSYVVSDSACNDTGKAVLVVSSPWDY
jgi:hypothetical protein